MAAPLRNLCLNTRNKIKILKTLKTQSVTSLRSINQKDSNRGRTRRNSSFKKFSYNVSMGGAGPFSWIKNVLQSWYMRYTLDPSFNADDFVLGAKQAISVVCQHLSEEKYAALSGLMTPEAVDFVRQRVITFDECKKKLLDIEVKDISIARIKTIEIEKLQDSCRVHVDIFMFAVKLLEDDIKTIPLPTIIEIYMRFCRDYKQSDGGFESASEWTICGVGQFEVHGIGMRKW